MKDKWNRVLALAAAAALGLSIAGCGSTASAGSGDNKDAAGVLEPSSESADSIADAGVETNVQAESVHTDST
ncbi:MAG: glutathione ABC transporter substrate-binding protein, partial [Eubacterium sp.]|nr:glutathione ABC transporter substrate-binding protein [Eubacterium sp.]